MIGLLGPNGAGKTTAIRVLTTILAPTSGSFEVAGISHNRPAEIRQRIGVLPESAGYPDQQTGEEFLRYHARLFGHSRPSAASVAYTLLAQVGLERARLVVRRLLQPRHAAAPRDRSRAGQRARVVFFDEPTLGLDPAGQREVLQLAKGIARERGATVVLSTHFLAEVEDTCSRVVILNRGRVIAEGTVADVTRLAAAPRRGRFRVPAEMLDRAVAALSRLPGEREVRPLDDRPDWVVTALDESEVAQATRALAEAGVPVLAFELEGARLSDAFLSMTAEA